MAKLDDDLRKLAPFIGKLSRMQELIWFLHCQVLDGEINPTTELMELIEMRDTRLSQVLKDISNKMQDGIYKD